MADTPIVFDQDAADRQSTTVERIILSRELSSTIGGAYPAIRNER